MLTCKICKSATSHHCSTLVLGKYDVKYYKCMTCGFIAPEEPYWLDEAYSSAITKLDIGLIQRNQLMTPIVKAVINKWFDPQARFIDYGGGYGMLVRMMRDRGFDFYWQDVHCANLYAESFDISDVAPFRAELLTAFEVFEHLVDPVSELEKMLTLTDTILFSTTVQPFDNVTPESWWYFTPETGQHVALHSRTSLQALADQFGLNYCWKDQSIHLFSRKVINDRVFKLLMRPRLCRWYNAISGDRSTLLQQDFLKVQKRVVDQLLCKS